MQQVFAFGAARDVLRFGSMGRPALWMVFGLGILGAAEAAPLVRVREVREPISGQYLVVLRDEAHHEMRATGDPKSEIALRFGVPVLRAYGTVLPGFAALMTAPEAERLAEDPRVVYVQEDGVVRARTIQTNAPWGLDRVDQSALPLDDRYSYDLRGTGVTAYIVDTGIRSTHVDFGGRVGTGFTAYSDGLGTEDCNGHGTHVAGTVGGEITGMAKDVALIPVRVLDCDGSGSLSDVIAGLDWIADNAPLPSVVNMSLGGPSDTALRQAVERLVAVGVVTVVAAGNDDVDACSQTPADATNAITVGATDDSDQRASFSNFGPCVDVFAPGVDIFSAYHTADDAAAIVSGTSQASPHVAGFAALLLELHPAETPAQIADRMLALSADGKVGNAGTGSTTRLLGSRFVAFEADPPTGPAPLEVRFLNTGNGGTAFDWDFGDGDTSAQRQPTHTFKEPGEYVVELTVDGSLGGDPLTIVVTGSEAAPRGESRLDGGFSCAVSPRSIAPPGALLALFAAVACLRRRR